MTRLICGNAEVAPHSPEAVAELELDVLEAYLKDKSWFILFLVVMEFSAKKGACPLNHTWGD